MPDFKAGAFIFQGAEVQCTSKSKIITDNYKYLKQTDILSIDILQTSLLRSNQALKGKVCFVHLFNFVYLSCNFVDFSLKGSYLKCCWRGFFFDVVVLWEIWFECCCYKCKHCNHLSCGIFSDGVQSNSMEFL